MAQVAPTDEPVRARHGWAWRDAHGELRLAHAGQQLRFGPPRLEPFDGEPADARPILGLIGLLKLGLDKFALLATQTEPAGGGVERITSVEACSLVDEPGPDRRAGWLAEQAAEHLAAAGFFVSWDKPGVLFGRGSPSTPGADNYRMHRFAWNFRLLRGIPEAAPVGLATPVMHGAVHTARLDGGTVTLISRRARVGAVGWPAELGQARSGCRYLRRGADCRGQVANFVETEQVPGAGSGWADGWDSWWRWTSGLAVRWCKCEALCRSLGTRGLMGRAAGASQVASPDCADASPGSVQERSEASPNSAGAAGGAGA